MKTIEQTKQDVINYLTKTSQHTFVDNKENIFKIVKIGNDFYDLRSDKKIDYEWYIRIYELNAKHVLKHSLFLDKKYKSIKTYKIIREEVEKFKQTHLE